jgi:undecaprenyl-diphosphatase
MNLDVLFLPLIQGITEFLPVSSTMHINIYEGLRPIITGYSVKLGQHWEIALHGGTLLTLFVFFWRDILSMAGAILSWPLEKLNIVKVDPLRNEDFNLAVAVILATIPALAAGFAINAMDIRLTPFMSLTSIIFGGLLWWADRFFRASIYGVSLKHAAYIGMAQVLAFIPGVSRSGACLTMCLLLGLCRIEALRFTFLLAIPTVLGAVTLGALDMMKSPEIFPLGEMAITALLTAGVGLFTIRKIFDFIENNGLWIFGAYRVFLGLVLIIFSMSMR